MSYLLFKILRNRNLTKIEPFSTPSTFCSNYVFNFINYTVVKFFFIKLNTRKIYDRQKIPVSWTKRSKDRWLVSHLGVPARTNTLCVWLDIPLDASAQPPGVAGSCGLGTSDRKRQRACYLFSFFSSTRERTLLRQAIILNSAIYVLHMIREK